MTLAALLLKPRLDAEGHARATISLRARRRILLLLLVNALLFSVLGGALLTRYLLPMYPLVLLVAVATFYRRGAVLAWAGAVLRGGVRAGLVCQSALWVRARRQSGVRAGGPAA